ncbi:MAG: hypothetical protein ACXAC2_00610 [Candidatus Kariarchaeaceae archaeon]|jgi:hypothetical protein
MKVIIIRDRYYLDYMVFSSDEKLLEYLRLYHPKAKNLRIMRNESGYFINAYNHNFPIFGYEYDIEEVEVDSEIKKLEEERW